jgi:signal transduction histidine kinase
VSAAPASPSINDLVGHADPAWLWDVARRRISWGNPAAVAFWGEDSLLDLIELEFDPDDATFHKLDRLATAFDEGSCLTRKFEFDLPSGRSWTPCKCYPSQLDDGRPGLLVLVDQTASASTSFSRFGEMVQEAPVPMALFSTDGVLLQQNLEAERLFGAAIRADGLSALLSNPDDALPLIARTIRSGTTSRALTLNTRHGVRAHRVTLRRIHDPETQTHALLVLARDIADRRARDEDARNERHEIQAMLDLVSGFQWRMDKQLRFTRITGEFNQATGLQAEALIGKSWKEVVQKFGLGPSPSLSDALSAQSAWRDEELLWPIHAPAISTPGRSSDVMQFTLSALPLHDGDGQFAGWNGLAAKSSATEPTRKEPATPQHDPETLLTSVTDGILMLDGEGRVVRASKGAEETLGSVSGERLADAFSIQDGERFDSYLGRLSQNTDEDSFDGHLDEGIEVRTKSNPPRHLLIVAQPLGADYAGAEFTAAVRDVTKAKHMEADLRDALSEAKSASTQKTGFLASVAHELRTPLNAIIGFSEIMRDERYGALGNERYLSYAGDIHDSGELLLSLINDLLDLSKVEAGKFEPQFEQVDVAGIVGQCVDMVKPGAADERISIRTQIADGLPELVADKRSLVQILLNLLSNAVKFTRAGGQVSVEAELSPEGDLTLRVQDTGIGMSEDDLSQALTPFGQARNAVVHGRKGTGLGLPLAKALTEANRGTLDIHSVPGDGTRVELVFPSTQVLQD